MPDQDNKIYFASDFHLGFESYRSTRLREKRVVQWLDFIAPNADEIYLMGDILDFWFEYRKAVPKGYVRFLGALSKIIDSGIPVSYFTGNHDIWVGEYLADEVGIKIFRRPVTKIIGNHSFFLAHGDGIGTSRNQVNLTRWIFENKFCQFLFSWLHPDIGLALMRNLSRRSRIHQNEMDSQEFTEDREWAFQFCEKYVLEKGSPDYFIMGHRHLPIDKVLSNKKSRYINLGDWISHQSYAVYDGEEVVVKTFKSSV